MASLAIPAVLAGVSGLAGLFGSRPTTTTQSGTNNSTQNTQYNYSPEQIRALNQLQQGYQDQINGADLSGYQTSGLKQINQSGDAAQTAIQNMLAQRGLSYSPAAATAQTQARIGQAGQQSDFLNSIPLLQYQMKTQALQNAGGFFNAQKVGSTVNTNQTSNVKQTGSGNMAGGLFAGIGSGIAGTLGKQFANQK